MRKPDSILISGAKGVLIVLLACAATGCVTQSGGRYDGAVTLALENDLLTGSDNNYTNGAGATWSSNELGTYGDDRFVSKWGRFWDFLPFVGDDGYRTYAAWTLAQEMNTPDDITNPNPPLDNQPYSGVLFVDSMLYARKERWGHLWHLRLGVSGPASLAGDTQREIHKILGDDKPEGWDTQLPSEPIIDVGYTAAYVLAQGTAGKSGQWRAVTLGSATLGTYFTGLGLGMYGEYGWNLVDALGGISLRGGLSAASTMGVGPVQGWSVSFFAGTGGYAIGRYLPLDGTFFKDSRSVDTKPTVGMVTGGISIRHKSFTCSLSQTYATKMYETQDIDTSFGTLGFSWYF